MRLAPKTRVAAEFLLCCYNIYTTLAVSANCKVTLFTQFEPANLLAFFFIICSENKSPIWEDICYSILKFSIFEHFNSHIISVAIISNFKPFFLFLYYFPFMRRAIQIFMLCMSSRPSAQMFFQEYRIRVKIEHIYLKMKIKY